VEGRQVKETIKQQKQKSNKKTRMAGTEEDLA